MIHLSLVLPIYNEESCLKESFDTISEYLSTLTTDYEIILVDDGSTDSTASIIKEIVQISPESRFTGSSKNRGKGNAVKRGVLDAAGKYIIFTDTDLAVPVHFIATCLKQLEVGTPMVIGSRHLPESSFKVREGPLRQFLGEVFRRFAKLSLGLRVSDITCGLKGLERAAAFDIFSRSRIDRWGYDAEIIFLAQKLGHTVQEIPIDWCHSFDSKVNMGLDSFRTFLEICRVYYYYRSKQYDC